MSSHTNPHTDNHTPNRPSEANTSPPILTPSTPKETTNTTNPASNTLTRKPRPSKPYANYHHTIQIFHYASRHLPLPLFQRLLTRTIHGYITTLFSADPLHNQPIPEGDETPRGCTEVVYLPSIFYADGSALGFRTGAAPGGDGLDRVEWLCFSGPVDPRILGALEIAPRGDGQGVKKRVVSRVIRLDAQEKSIAGEDRATTPLAQGGDSVEEN
ncbi:hypothetical protein J1614_003365 [Plenodomus biglobosus]|nr:hypothetical protein J1614_003365 [Plenodomus biglobosus]